MIIRTCAYARGGLIGNPSDGYFGKTISIIARNYRAEVVLYESPKLVIVPSEQDIAIFDSIEALVDEICRHGYYGGVRLIKASIRRFHDYCVQHGIALDPKNFTVSYETDIPRLVGMAGSSAVVTATMRALMRYYGVVIPKVEQANLILSVESRELGIAAGLQDRVCQVYDGAVYMDFNEKTMKEKGHGNYEELDPALLPPIYMAYDRTCAEGSERVHNRIRALFDAGDPVIADAMREFARLAETARNLIVSGRGNEIGPLVDRNFDLRARIYSIAEKNMAMVKTARSVGASAQFAGSGGTIIGTYEDEAMYAALERGLSGIGCVVFKPELKG